jgi:thiol-disulfide isomerase/thioredoxin
MQEIKDKKDFNLLFKNNDKKIVIIDVFSNYCHPCQLLKPIFEDECKKYDDVECASLNIDKNKYTEKFGKENEINVIPYLMVWKKKGNKFIYLGGKTGGNGIDKLFKIVEDMEVKDDE